LLPLAAIELAILGAILGALPAAAQTARTVSYSILKEGDPIGKEVYDIAKEGERTIVKLAVQSDVHILFLDFRYRHNRTEVWDGDHLVKLSADTDDDGSKHHVEAVADGQGGLTVTSDNKPILVAADSYPLSMWQKSIVGHANLFAVESNDAPYRVTFRDVGAETLTIGDRKLECEHYAMTGDVDRDLWYDADGMLAKVNFRRRGFGISIVRDSTP
jgi:hypothetical protein